MRCLRRLYSIIDSVADGLFTVNEKMQITNFNKAAEALTGVTHEHALGKPCKDIFKTNCCERGCPIKEALSIGQSVQRDIELTDLNGTKRYCVCQCLSIFDCAGGVQLEELKHCGTLTPISEIKEEIRNKYTFRRLVSRNGSMRRLFDIMEDVAASEATVFLHGESGTGKELFAHAIHDLSPRQKGPLITVNCGALPETLLESEIFGVRKGVAHRCNRVASRQNRAVSGGNLFSR